jgi:CheY-like chemotaxis protein
MGGEIWAESEEGVGSCFGFKIPMQIAEEANLASVELPEHLSKVLVVDPNTINRDILRRQLEFLGVATDGCQTGQAALQQLADGYDLILFEQDMSDMTNAEFLSSVRDVNATVPIFALSSNPGTHLDDSVKSLVAAELQRPLQREKLIAALSELEAQDAPPENDAATLAEPGPAPLFRRHKDPEPEQSPEKVTDATETDNSELPAMDGPAQTDPSDTMPLSEVDAPEPDLTFEDVDDAVAALEPLSVDTTSEPAPTSDVASVADESPLAPPADEPIAELPDIAESPPLETATEVETTQPELVETDDVEAPASHDDLSSSEELAPTISFRRDPIPAAALEPLEEEVAAPSVPAIDEMEELQPAEPEPSVNLIASEVPEADADPISAPEQTPEMTIEICDTEKASIPVVDTEPAPNKPGASDELRKMRILAAEDNKTNQLVFRKMIKSLDIELQIANNGIEAVAAYQSFQPDMVFMDISMPEMDGKEATGEIRKIEQTTGKHIPVVALTAHAQNGDEAPILQAGLDHYLTKPLRKPAIHDMIRQLVPDDVRPPFGNEEDLLQAG